MMNPYFIGAVLFAIFVIALFALALLIWSDRRRTSTVVGAPWKNPLEEYNHIRHEQKELHKRKVVEFIKQNGRITNPEAQKITGVGDPTATRYFDELEKEGKVIQHHENSHTFYILK